MRRVIAVAALAAGSTAVGLASWVPTALALPAGFTDTTIASPAANPLALPTDISPLPDGRALILEKAGAVRVLGADGAIVAADALQLSVCTNSEEGLLGAAADPAFATNGFVFLYYTVNAGNCASSTGRHNRVSRFTMSGNTIDLQSQLVLLDNMNIPAGNHNGGDLHVGGDGDLYVSVGDGGANPRGNSPVAAAQDLSILNGKIMRITLGGGVPADNPFVGQPGAQSCATTGITAPTSAKCTEIFAYGLRNPFRFAFDPNTAIPTFFINDVGQDTWEEVDAGAKGANYGWNSREGLCNSGSTTNCPPTPAGFTDPLTVYHHGAGCEFITAGVFVPKGVWPARYDDSYLFADGGCGSVWERTAAGGVDDASPFAQTSGLIVDMTFLTQRGTTALFYVTNQTGQLHQVTFDYGTRSTEFVINTGLPNSTVVAQVTTDNYDTGTGWTAAYACAAGFKGTSSSNNTGNPIASNLVIVPTDATGNICVRSYQPTDLIVDIAGSLGGSAITTPNRVLDTRTAGGALVAGQDKLVHLGAANVNVVAQLTTDNYEGGTGWTAVFSCTTGFQNTSSLNNRGNPIASNLVIARTDANGDVCVRSLHATDLVVDVSGTLGAATITSPTRVLDSRTAGGSTKAVDRTVKVGPPNSVVVLQVTTDNYETGTGWTDVYACAGGFLGASSLNNTAYPIASNLVIVPTDAAGNVCVKSLHPTDLVIDIAGTLTNAQIHNPTRVLDTRRS